MALRSRFEILSRIGTGKYGKVFKARDLRSGDFVAIKKIRLDEDDDGVPHWAIREISFLKSTRHENVIRYGCFWFGLIVVLRSGFFSHLCSILL
jgi:serine/threonine protein kinase